MWHNNGSLQKNNPPKNFKLFGGLFFIKAFYFSLFSFSVSLDINVTV